MIHSSETMKRLKEEIEVLASIFAKKEVAAKGALANRDMKEWDYQRAAAERWSIRLDVVCDLYRDFKKENSAEANRQAEVFE